MRTAICEDYPCCGHTDGLGCDYTPDYEYIYKHIGCDHEAFPCLLTEDDPEGWIASWARSPK